ncbi:hypothetical protein D6827_02930 [Candidatus Parcubacteria bacterium]|nr:MAG: hypothetical protein D6827_02930 [Candidatus Parcubacteria bacterium]
MNKSTKAKTVSTTIVPESIDLSKLTLEEIEAIKAKAEAEAAARAQAEVEAFRSSVDALVKETGVEDVRALIKRIESVYFPKSHSRKRLGEEKRKAIENALMEASKGNTNKTGSEIAIEYGVSLPTVQKIKKELGLVNSR